MGKRLDDRSPYYYRDSWVDDVTKFAHRPYSSLAIAVNGAHLRRRFTVTVCGSCSGLVLSDRVNNDSLIDTVTQGEYHQRPEQNTRIKNNEILLPLNFDISRFNVIGSFVTRGLREGDFKSINTMESRQALIIWIFTFSSRTRASYTNAQTTRRVSGIRSFRNTQLADIIKGLNRRKPYHGLIKSCGGFVQLSTAILFHLSYLHGMLVSGEDGRFLGFLEFLPFALGGYVFLHLFFDPPPHLFLLRPRLFLKIFLFAFQSARFLEN